jgi:hypothetical protein
MRAPSVNGLSGEGRGTSGDWPVGPARKWRNAGERLRAARGGFTVGPK